MYIARDLVLEINNGSILVLIVRAENRLPFERATNLIQCVAGKRPVRPRRLVKHGAESSEVLPVTSP